MKVRILLFSFLLIIIKTEYLAQLSISGTIIDTSFNPVNNALVEIFEAGDRFNYYQAITDNSGSFLISNIVSDVVRIGQKIPENHLLLRNYPNPFNPSTIIHFELNKPEKIKIKIYDLLGSEIKTLFEGYKDKGTYQIYWTGENKSGIPVSAGVYFCRLSTSNNEFNVHKMVLLDGGANYPQANQLAVLKTKSDNSNKEESKFIFSVRVSSAEINPIVLSNIICTGDTTLQISATLPYVQQIGAGGGEFSNGEFYVNIPAGSLSEDREIKLYHYPPAENILDRRVTKVYRLEGLPPNFNTKLKIGLKYEGDLIENSVINIGVMEFLPELNDSVIIYNPHSAIDSAGFLWATYPNRPAELNSLSKAGSKTKSEDTFYEKHLHLVGKTGNKLFTTDNFYGNIPEYAWNMPILNYLEIAYAKFNTMGFTFQPDDIKLNGSQANVIVSSLGPIHRFHDVEDGEIFGNGLVYISKEIANPNIFYRQINLSFFWWVFMDDYPFKNRLQAISGIVLFDALTRVYDTKEQYDYRSTNCERYWFHKASSFWSGELFTTEENYIPPGFKGNELAPFRGMVAGACNGDDREIRMHGYGMASLVKYLMDKAETDGRFNTFLIDVYKDIFSDKNPADAIINNMNVPLEIWWQEYFKEYISGNIYSVNSSKFLNAPNKELLKIDINDNSSSNAVIAREYPDLSAKLFQFNLNYTETNETNELQLKPSYQLISEASPTTLIFGLNNDKLEYINGGIGSIKCNIKDAQAKGYKTLLAAVISSFYNPLTFSDNSIIDLSVKTKDKDSLNFSIVKVKTLATFKYNNDDTYEGTYRYNTSGDAHYGTFENGKFESEWLEAFGSGSSKGKIEITADLISGIPKITSFYVKETEITSDIEVNIIEGRNIELFGYRRPFGGYEFYITGNETCSNITAIQNAYQGEGDYGWHVTDIGCDDNSYLQIIIGSD